MDNVTMIRVICGVLFVIVLIFLIQRRRKKVHWVRSQEPQAARPGRSKCQAAWPLAPRRRDLPHLKKKCGCRTVSY